MLFLSAFAHAIGIVLVLVQMALPLLSFMVRGKLRLRVSTSNSEKLL